MKIFYDADGKVVGEVSSDNPDIEAGMSMPGFTEMVVSDDIAKRIADPTDSMSNRTIKVVDGEVVDISESELIKKEKADQKSRDKANKAEDLTII